MGVGGGGILVAYLTLFAGGEQLSSQLMNLIFFLSSSVAAIGVNLFKKRLRPGIILALTLPGIPGAVAGAFFAHSVDPHFLAKGFGGMLVAFGVLSLWSSFRNRKG